MKNNISKYLDKARKILKEEAHNYAISLEKGARRMRENGVPPSIIMDRISVSVDRKRLEVTQEQVIAVAQMLQQEDLQLKKKK